MLVRILSGGSDFAAADFAALGTRLGVPARATHKVLTQLAIQVDSWLPDLDRLPFDCGQLAKLRRVIANRRKRLT